MLHLLDEDLLVLEPLLQDQVLLLLPLEVELEQHLVLFPWALRHVRRHHPRLFVVAPQSHDCQLQSLLIFLEPITMQRGTAKTRFAEQFSQSSQNDSRVRMQDVNEGRPVLLFKVKPTGKIELNPEALDVIASIDAPVGFVSLVGKTRTGKSFLMNRLLHLTGEGFKVDSSTSSCTEGIWMWSEPYLNQQNNNMVFFLDTQGTDSLIKDSENDVKIFTMAVLISTYLIYNSVGTIDERSINELEMVTALSKQIETGDESGQLHYHMPKFMWLLRDFMLELEDERGRRISSNQYLENCLSSQNTIGRPNQQSQKIKTTIVKNFPNRECQTLVRPDFNERDLQHLDEMPDSSLRPQFIKGVQILRNKIMANTGPKTYKEKPVDGPSMASIIESYAEAFNSGRVPNIKTAWEQIADNEGEIAYEAATNRFQELFAIEFSEEEPKGQEIHRLVAKLRQESTRTFEENCYGNRHQKFEQQLREYLDEKEEMIISANDNLNQQRNVEILAKHAQKLKTRVESNYYMGQGKTTQINDDINDVVRKYNAEARGDKKEEIVSEFLSTVTAMALNMKQDDQEQQEATRKAEIVEREYMQKLKNLQRQNESMKKQIEAKDKADTYKTSKKPLGDKPRRQNSQDKDSKGCCGGNCEVM